MGISESKIAPLFQNSQNTISKQIGLEKDMKKMSVFALKLTEVVGEITILGQRLLPGIVDKPFVDIIICLICP